MHLRRSLALVSGALLLTAPLSACGFDRATERENIIATGATNREASVDVLNAVIVSGAEGSGTFIATFVNNDTGEDASVESLATASGGDAQVAEFSPIDLDAGGAVNLADEDADAPTLKGDVAAGQVIPMTVELSGSQIVDIDVPVLPACHQYEGLDHTATTGSPDNCEVAPPEGSE